MLKVAWKFLKVACSRVNWGSELLIFQKFPEGQICPKILGFCFGIFRMENRTCGFDFCFTFSAILRAIWRKHAPNSSKLDLICSFLLFWGSKSCLHFLIWCSKLLESCLGFPKIEAQSLEKKVANKKKMRIFCEQLMTSLKSSNILHLCNPRYEWRNFCFGTILKLCPDRLIWFNENALFALIS